MDGNLKGLISQPFNTASQRFIYETVKRIWSIDMCMEAIVASNTVVANSTASKSSRSEYQSSVGNR